MIEESFCVQGCYEWKEERYVEGQSRKRMSLMSLRLDVGGGELRLDVGSGELRVTVGSWRRCCRDRGRKKVGALTAGVVFKEPLNAVNNASGFNLK